MAKSKELKEYLKQEKENKERIEEEFFQLMNELDGSDLTVDERRKKLREYVRMEKDKQSIFARYNNFIMDVRKPSFGFFIMWVCLSVFGFIVLFIRILKVLF